jgi:hypothetical protein
MKANSVCVLHVDTELQPQSEYEPPSGATAPAHVKS